jgi:hypothetical protein
LALLRWFCGVSAPRDRVSARLSWADRVMV